MFVRYKFYTKCVGCLFVWIVLVGLSAVRAYDPDSNRNFQATEDIYWSQTDVTEFLLVSYPEQYPGVAEAHPYFMFYLKIY